MIDECPHADHSGPTEEAVERRIAGTEIVVRYCPEHDPLDDRAVAGLFEEVDAGA